MKLLIKWIRLAVNLGVKPIEESTTDLVALSSLSRDSVFGTEFDDWYTIV